MGGKRLSFHVFLLFVPHHSPRPPDGPPLSPRASSNHANALDCLDSLSGERTVGVAESLDGGSFGAGRHQRLDAMVPAVLRARGLLPPLPRFLPLTPIVGGLTGPRKRPLFSGSAADPNHPQQVVLPVFPPFRVSARGRGDVLLHVRGALVF